MLGQPGDLLDHLADEQGVLVPLRGDQPGAHAAALDHRIRRHRAAVQQQPRLAQEDVQRLAQILRRHGQRPEHARGRIAPRRRTLGDRRDGAVGVQHGAIRKRAADVHADVVHGLLLARCPAVCLAL